MIDRNGMVQLMATAFFTANSPTTRIVLHGDDRKGADPKARYPYVTPEDAEFLIGKGWAKPHDGKVPTGDELDVDQRAGIYADHYTEADQSTDRSTGLDTRQSTVFEAPIEQIAGAGGGGRAFTAIGKLEQRQEGDAPVGGGRKASGSNGNGNGDGKPKPYARMTKGELEAEAAKEPVVDLSTFTNNEDRAAALVKARGAEAPAAQ